MPKSDGFNLGENDDLSRSSVSPMQSFNWKNDSAEFKFAFAHGGRRKSVTSLLILVTWKLWKERNAQTFNKSIMPTTIFEMIKLKARNWNLADAKHLSTLILEDRLCFSLCVFHRTLVPNFFLINK
jgi:hypothetical protein